MRRTVGVLLGVATAVAATLGVAAPAEASTLVGYDISFPQCGKALPSSPAFGVVGVGGGKAFAHNPCVASEYTWAAGARRAPAFYMNTGNPGTLSTRWTMPGPRSCNGTDGDGGCAYNYGWNNAADALAYAASQVAAPGTRAWWLDVEVANSWSTNTALNVTTIQGSIDYLRSQGVPGVGVYSTAAMWQQITGGTKLAVPSWPAGARSKRAAKNACAGPGFTGGGVAMAQFPLNGFDGDVLC
jgi:hypothetical protein